MSATEITTDTSTNSNEPLTCWIKFKETNGKIYSISATPIDESDEYIVVQSQSEYLADAKKTSLRKYVMTWSTLTDEWMLTPKRSKLVLRNSDYKIHQIPHNAPWTADINVVAYKDNSTFEVSVNIDHLKSSMNLESLNEIVKSDDVHMNMYLTSKYDPDLYLGTLKLNPEQVIVNGTVSKKVPDISKHIDWQDLVIHTRKMFTSYSFSIDTVKLERNEVNNRLINTSNSEQGHIEIQRVPGGIKVLSHINETNSYIISNVKHLLLLVSDDIIDNIVGSFSLDTDKLINKKSFVEYLDFEWPDDPIVSYRNNILEIKLIGESNE